MPAAVNGHLAYQFSKEIFFTALKEASFATAILSFYPFTGQLVLNIACTGT